MIRFFDTSALVKRYVDEPGSAMVRSALRAHLVSVARVAFAEAAAAVARAARLGAITDSQRDVILGRLPHDFTRLSVIEMRPALIARVSSLVTRHPLRAYDAIQLASALALRQAEGPVELWCADGVLLEAAIAEGFRVVKPE
ncbi:MAG: type II toxin-antitoxin system VapC family toxin [Polyangiaceae bacterium]|nr:type II toxin-antitoxin system VapC family toxin [Polyangiaceae bacterium]